MLKTSQHTDTFSRDNLPPESQWPEFLLEGYDYPDKLNVAYELTDSMVEKGFGDNTALIGNGRRRTYKELTDWSSRLAHVLVEDFNIEPGNRILIRSANNPAMVACWLAATKVGAVVVNTMPMLRCAALSKIIDKAEVHFALCDTRLLDELNDCEKSSKYLQKIVGFDGSSNHEAELDELALRKSVKFESIQTSSDDVALLGFTSGTTGEPKATMHFHRDLLIIADAYAKEVLQVTPDDVFIGSPPLAFTFGLGGLAVFPLRFGATATLIEKASPEGLIGMIEKYKATICFTAPTAYKTMLAAIKKGADLTTLRVAISAGETLPAPIYQDWIDTTGKPLVDGIGATELLHIFISNRIDSHKASCTGRVIKGYKAIILDDDGDETPSNTVGKLAVKGPTGCRYLDDKRQLDYVINGWNIIGDCFSMDETGAFHFVARNDDMIISSGYNIAAPDVEAALLQHPFVDECAVVGVDDENRGSIVQAHIVLVKDQTQSDETIKTLQDHVKNTIAPYKYPRSIVFCQSIPKTVTGKIQRFSLKK